MNNTPGRYIGWRVLVDDKSFSVIEVGAPEGTLTLVDVDGTKVTIGNERFRDLIHAEMAFDPNEDANTRNQMLDKKDQLELSFRKRVLYAIRLLRGAHLTWSAAYTQLFLDFATDTYASRRVGGFPSLRTIKAWDSADRRKGEIGLRPRHHKKGNRTPRYDVLFEKITLDILEERFLTSDRMTITKLGELVKGLYKEKCKDLNIKPGPCGHKSVTAIVQSLPHADVVKLRLGSAEARKQYLLAMKVQQVALPFERVEADCTPLDLWCVDDDGDPVGRPTVCAAIDCATGILLGLQIAWGAPTSSLVARTIKEVFVPKSDEFFERFNITNRFQAIGTPQQIVSDQGSENSGPLIQSMMSSTWQDWLKCIPGQPDKKPFIERFFRELSRFITQFKGASQTSEIGPKKRTKLAQTEATYTIQEVEEMLQRWRYDVYAQKQRRRVQNILRTNESPFAAWTRLSRKHILPPAPNPAQVREMFMVEEAVRVAERYGIMYKNICYASFELRNYLERVGVRNKVQIRYDPNDIREIAVRDELIGDYFFVPTKRDNCPALSFAQLDKARKALKTQAHEEIQTQAILAEQQIYEDFNGRDHDPKSKRARTRAQKAIQIAKEKNRELVERSDHNPGADPFNSTKRERVKPSFSMPSNMPNTNKDGQQ